MALQTCYKCGSVLPPGCEACPNCGAPAPWSDDEISSLSARAPQAPATVFMPSPAPAAPDYGTPVQAAPDYGSETRPIGAGSPSDLSLNEEVLRPQHNAPEPVAAPSAPRAPAQSRKTRAQKKKKKQNSTSQLVITLTVLVVIVMLLLIFFTGGDDPDTVPMVINGLNML